MSNLNLNNNLTFKTAWLELEKTKKFPSQLRNLIVIDFKELKEKVLKEESKFVEEITNSIFNGDCYIIKKTFTEEFMEDLKRKTFDHFKDKPSTFHKMLENHCPDFHRLITKEIGLKYAFKACKHSFYFFPWNEDELKIFEPINEKWRIIKKMMGLELNEYENNTPKDGIVDRIQVVQYPSKDGFLELHTDPYKFQKFFISGYMSKKGRDFNDGGVYLINQKGLEVDAESLIDIGDVGIGFATVQHGVAPVNLNKEPNFDDINDGRWFLGLYSNQSDEVKDRHTGKAVNKNNQ